MLTLPPGNPRTPDRRQGQASSKATSRFVQQRRVQHRLEGDGGISPSGARSDEPPTKPRTRSALRKQPVLVVDDYADSRATMRDMLEELGLEVVEASDGQEAFNFLVFHPEVRVQLILLDLDMPRMNGFDFLTLLKSYLRLASIPVVVVSRQAEQLPPRQRSAINGAFQAPYDHGRLRAMVEALVAH